MRLPNALWTLGATLGAIAASAAFSEAALGQGSTWGGRKASTPAPVADAGPSLSTWGGSSPRAGAATANVDAASSTEEEEDEEEDAGPSPPPAPATTEGDAGEPDGGGGYEPSDVGFSVGLRGGYGVPFGLANGSSLNQVALGMVPLGVDVGWFFSPHLYLGGYFFYGFAVGSNQYNDACNDPDISCSVSMIRVGMVLRYHFKPAATWDPWVGAGLGYELINATETDQSDDSSDLSSALQAVDATFEAGLDFKPIHYIGFGPYVEVATGPYIVSSGLDFHGWTTFGLRFRTNL